MNEVNTLPENEKPVTLKGFLALLIPGVIGILALLYQIYIQADRILSAIEEEIPIAVLLFASMFQPLLLLSLAILGGLTLRKTSGLRSVLVEIASGHKISNFAKNVPAAILLGLIAGSLIIGFDYLFINYVEPIPQDTAFSERTVALTIAGMLYGGIVEEILLRWGLMSLIVWGIFKLIEKTQKSPSPVNYWVSTIFVALIFAAGHLPAVFTMFENPSGLFLGRTMLLNTAAGIMYGYLFFTKNLETSMIAHAATHLAMTAMTEVLF